MYALFEVGMCDELYGGCHFHSVIVIIIGFTIKLCHEIMEKRAAGRILMSTRSS